MPSLGRQTWAGLNKRNNGFYCDAGSDVATHPWQGAWLSVEQPVSKSTANWTWLIMTSSGSLTETPLPLFPAFLLTLTQGKVVFVLVLRVVCFAPAASFPFIRVNNEAWSLSSYCDAPAWHRASKPLLVSG